MELIHTSKCPCKMNSASFVRSFREFVLHHWSYDERIILERIVGSAMLWSGKEESSV